MPHWCSRVLSSKFVLCSKKNNNTNVTITELLWCCLPSNKGMFGGPCSSDAGWFQCVKTLLEDDNTITWPSSHFYPSCLASGLPPLRGLPCGVSGWPATQDHSQDHGGADHHRTDHQGRADRRQRPPLVEGVHQLPATAASKNTLTVYNWCNLRWSI